MQWGVEYTASELAGRPYACQNAAQKATEKTEGLLPRHMITWHAPKSQNQII